MLESLWSAALLLAAAPLYKEPQWQIQSDQPQTSSESQTPARPTTLGPSLGLFCCSFFDIFCNESCRLLLSLAPWRKGETHSRWWCDVNWFLWETFNAEKRRCCKSWQRTAIQRYAVMKNHLTRMHANISHTKRKVLVKWGNSAGKCSARLRQTAQVTCAFYQQCVFSLFSVHSPQHV